MKFTALTRFFNPRRNHFGLDIGNGNIKIVEVQHQSDKPLLTVVSQAPMPVDIYRDGQILDQRALADKIREVVSKGGVSTPRCVFAVEGQHIVNRFLSFPAMTKAEVLEVVKWDAEKYIPYPLEACYLDVIILEPVSEAKDMCVLLVAATKEIIDTHVETLLKAELTPVGIDFGALALGRTFMGKESHHTTVILDIGASSTKMTFFRGSTMSFSRTMPFGGKRITKVIQDVLKISWDEAEAYKIGRTNLLQTDGLDSDNATAVRSVLQLSVKDLKREIQRSLEYYRTQNRGEVLENILFTGGGALLPGLSDALLTDLALHVLPADLTTVVEAGPAFDKKFLQCVSPLYGTALGLAVWEESL